jgi:hypothetical protein
MYPHIVTNSTLTIILDGVPNTIEDSHTNYLEALEIARIETPSKELDEHLLELVKPIKQFTRIFGSDVTGFYMVNDVLQCKVQGKVFTLPETLYAQVLSIYREGGNLQPLYNFVVKLSKNPRQEVVRELWDFIYSCGLALTKSGNFLAYKNVNTNFKDIYTNTMDNSPGSTLKMDRSEVEHNPDVTCARGLHFAAWGYLKHYAHGGRTVILSISPKNVVSIPTDYNNMKGRAYKYKVLREVEQPEELKAKSVWSDYHTRLDEWQDNMDVKPDFNGLVEVEFVNGYSIKSEITPLTWGICPDTEWDVARFKLLELYNE